VAAALALIIFGLINFAAYKIIPITLTLPAITGFLISIGTAVDGNILIFERMKEELRAGQPLDEAMRLGFERAWTSIRDSNTSTIIICIILWFFGGSFGARIVQGFALTLGLGLLVNLFTAVIVTQTFLTVIVKFSGNALDKRRWLLGV
jgi:preprotein translocase subunit SecD